MEISAMNGMKAIYMAQKIIAFMPVFMSRLVSV